MGSWAFGNIYYVFGLCIFSLELVLFGNCNRTYFAVMDENSNAFTNTHRSQLKIGQSFDIRLAHLFAQHPKADNIHECHINI